MTSPPPIVLIGGPTASGKSALALAFGQALTQQGQRVVILNADALQIYRDLRVVTARPSTDDEALLPHKLYGVMDAATRGTVASWLALISTEIETALQANIIPIIVGGTGMYLHALQNGLVQMPDIASEVRAEAVALHTDMGGTAFRQKLAGLDPSGAAKLHDGDRQRLIRAYEVVRGTGRPLSEWQNAQTDKPPVHWRFKSFVVEPTRLTLYANCDKRFDLMLQNGAMEEVQQLAARGLDADLPAMKAVGVPELIAVLNGTGTLEQARIKAQQATRNYAKRQLTWFRHQLPEARRILPDTMGDISQQLQNLL